MPMIYCMHYKAPLGFIDERNDVEGLMKIWIIEIDCIQYNNIIFMYIFMHNTLEFYIHTERERTIGTWNMNLQKQIYSPSCLLTWRISKWIRDDWWMWSIAERYTLHNFRSNELSEASTKHNCESVNKK